MSKKSVAYVPWMAGKTHRGQAISVRLQPLTESFSQRLISPAHKEIDWQGTVPWTLLSLLSTGLAGPLFPISSHEAKHPYTHFWSLSVLETQSSSVQYPTLITDSANPMRHDQLDLQLRKLRAAWEKGQKRREQHREKAHWGGGTDLSSLQISSKLQSIHEVGGN